MNVSGLRIAIVGVGLGSAGCNQITGVDDFQFGNGGAVATGGANTQGAGGAGAGASGGAAAGGAAAGGAAAGGGGGGGGAGGAPSCDLATQKPCASSCVALTDPAYGCDDTGSCMSCSAGYQCCPSCTNTVTDFRHCGGCTTECGDSEWCEGSSCTCLPGLVSDGANCVDPLANPADCGGNGPCDGATPVCQNGSCVATCGGGTTNCSGACADLDESPLNCGFCGHVCEFDKVCVAGQCQEYRPAEGCNSCPCMTCAGDFDRCCLMPGSATPICVSQDAPVCP